jgi:TolB-like protein/tetratricopeptide (TPR) repeat protein
MSGIGSGAGWITGFFAELYRRKVVKVGVVYLLVAFGAMEVAGNFFPALHLPDTAQTMLAAFLVLGLPVSVALAWAFEVTPSGIRLELDRRAALAGRQEVEPAADSCSLTPTLALGTEPVWSIAVLPFADLSPGGDHGFFVEGVAEEIRHALSRVTGLSVVARCSSVAFRDAGLDVREIGRQLGVSAALEGSLRKWGDRVIITTQLVSVADGFEIWSDSYDGSMDDIFTVQSRIAGAILAAVAPRLHTSTPLIRGSTTNPAAHRAFLKGRHLCDSAARDDLERAVHYFREATASADDYAAAHVGLADACSNMARLGHARPRDIMPHARAAVLKAIAIDPALAAAHKSHGVILHRFVGDVAGAEAAFRQAIALNPGYAGARYALGEFLMLTGRLEEALEMLELAQDVDPVSTIGNAHLIMAYELAGQHERAALQAEDAFLLNPRSATACRELGLLRHRQGRLEEAADVLHQARLLEPDSPESIVALAVVHAASGEFDQALRLREELHALAERPWSRPYHDAAISAALGDRARAFAGLQACFDERLFDRARIHLDPLFAGLRADPVFVRLRGPDSDEPPAALLAAGGRIGGQPAAAVHERALT